MAYPEPPPSVSVYVLVTAVVTIVSVGITIIPIYCPPTPNPWYSPVLIAGPSVALSTALNIRLFTVMGIVGIISVWIGLGVGMLVHYIFDVANGGVYSRMWACLLLYPYTFVSSLGMPAAKCKLGDFTLANLATALAYIPVGFYVGDAYSEAWIAGVSVTFGTIVPWIVIFLFQAFHLIPSPGLPITQQLPYSAANFFDLLTGYFICASDHKNAISAESEEFSQVCFAAAKQKLPVKLSSVFWNIAGELFSLKDCLLIQDLEPGIIAYIWKPLATDFSLLRSEVGIVLRKTARGVPEEADRNLDGRIVHCGELIIDVVSDLNRRAVEGSIKRPSTTAIVQFYYALGSMMYIAGLAEKYRVASVAQKREEQQARLDKKNRILNRRALLNIPISFWKGIVAWFKKPFFYDIKEKSDIWRRLIFPLRFSLTLFALAFSMVVWGMYSETVALHGFWAVIPVYVSFLPTAGATLIKGTRRICGTLLGGAVAVICILANPGDRAAFFCEMIIIVFLGRLAQFDKRIDYAGYVFSLTWLMVGFGSILVAETKGDMLYTTLWRFVFTTSGVVITTISSCFIFPEFASSKLDRASARMLAGVSDKVVSALDDFYYQTEGLARNGVHSDGDSTTADEATPPPVISDDREQFGAAGFKSMAERAALLDDAKVETIVFKKIHLVHDVTKRVLKNQKLMNEVLRDGLVLYSSLVLSAKHLNDPSVSQALFPLVGSIRELAKAIKTSSDRMVNYLYDAGSTPGMLDHLPSDVHALVEECADNFQSFRKDVVEDVMNGGNKLQAMRGINGVSFCHTVYALTMFAERWNALEAQLHSGGHNATVELATRPPPAQMALMVLRSRSNMV